MNTTPPALPFRAATSQSEETVSKPKPVVEITPLLLSSVTVLVIAGDVFLRSIPGLGFGIFFMFLGIVLILNRPGSLSRGKDWIWLGLLLATAIQTGIETGPLNILLLLILIAYGSGHFLHRRLSPFWRRAIEGLWGTIWVPISFLTATSVFRVGFANGVGDLVRKGFRKSNHWVRIALPAIALCVPFIILLLAGNAVMRSAVGDFFSALPQLFHGAETPGSWRILLWIVLAVFCFSLLVKSPASPLPLRIKGNLKSPKDLNLAVGRTRISLIAVNVLFLFANSTDISFLWGERALPDGVTHSQFVHHGVYSLITSIFLSAFVLSIIFCQVKEVCHSRWIRVLGHLWILQNLLMVCSVVLRLKLYIDAYQLSLLRVYTVFGLALASIGFILLAIRMQRDRKLGWLVNANVLAAFLLFFAMQFWNEHRFVAEWNVNAAAMSSSDSSKRKLDIEYLKGLGPGAWVSLQRVADHPEKFGIWAGRSAERELEKLRKVHRPGDKNWKEFQLRRYLAAKAISQL